MFHNAARAVKNTGLKSEDQVAGLVPIRAVYESTGVNAITLSSWELRYELINPTGSPVATGCTLKSVLT
jgi:hypothetical protein